MKVLLIFLALLFSSAASGRAQVSPPKTIAGTIALGQATKATGAFERGMTLFYFAPELEGYIAVSLTSGLLDSGSFQYSTQGNTARLVLNSDEGAILIYSIELETQGGGTFQLESDLGTQSGNFEMAWIYYPDQSPNISLSGVIEAQDDTGAFPIAIQLESSADLKTWSPAEGEWELSEDGKAIFRVENPASSKFLRVIPAVE